MENKETLEEFIRKSYLSRLENHLSVDFEDGVKLGDKWQQERIDNDMIEFSWWLIKNLGKYSDDYIAHFKGEYLKQWKQLKNK
jgi:hypothetical protein